MQLYLDSANTQEIQKAIKWGVIDGITTNPSLIKKEVQRLQANGQQADFEAHIKELLQLAGADRPVSLEVTATTTQEMIRQATYLYEHFNTVAGNVVIKVPVDADMGQGNNFDALQVIEALYAKEIPVNCTLIFTPEQALLAAKAGASYVSPFCGRVDDYIRAQNEIEFQKTDYFPQAGWETEDEEDTLDDNGIVSGVDLVEKIAELFEKHEIECDIIAASMRNTRQIREVALAGSHIATINFSLLQAMVQHPKTKEGMMKFTQDVVTEYQQLVDGIAGTTTTAQPAGEETAAQQSAAQQQSPTQPQMQQQPVQPQSPAPQQEEQAEEFIQPVQQPQQPTEQPAQSQRMQPPAQPQEGQIPNAAPQQPAGQPSQPQTPQQPAQEQTIQQPAQQQGQAPQEESEEKKVPSAYELAQQRQQGQ